MQDEYDKKKPYRSDDHLLLSWRKPLSDGHFYYLIAVMSHQMTIYYDLKENPVGWPLVEGRYGARTDD